MLHIGSSSQFLIQHFPSKKKRKFQIDSANISAWSALATFVSNQIRFGYEMERMLRAELKKLGINDQRKVA